MLAKAYAEGGITDICACKQFASTVSLESQNHLFLPTPLYLVRAQFFTE